MTKLLICALLALSTLRRMDAFQRIMPSTTARRQKINYYGTNENALLSFRPSTNNNNINNNHKILTIPCGSHQFNGGYDASALQAGAKWNPLEAVEFVIWNIGDNYEEMGHQLTPLIQNWSGRDWGEFLTRLYLGETNTAEFEVTFESRNVQNPQWKGLDTDEGLNALQDLLRTAMPDAILEDPIEIANLAEVFLWKEHTWPAENATKGGNTGLEVASFASLGHTDALVQIWKGLSDERGCTWITSPSVDDVLDMIPMPRKEWGSVQLHGMQEFFKHMKIRLTRSEKVELVQGMAHGGWNPGKIAKFVSTFPEILERPPSLPPQETIMEPLPEASNIQDDLVSVGLPEGPEPALSEKTFDPPEDAEAEDKPSKPPFFYPGKSKKVPTTMAELRIKQLQDIANTITSGNSKP